MKSGEIALTEYLYLQGFPQCLVNAEVPFFVSLDSLNC